MATSGYIPGPGPKQEDHDVGTRLLGLSDYRAGMPGYHRELSDDDRRNAAIARGRQVYFGDQLERRASGTAGPSVAELQLNRGMNQAQNRLGQQAASARGMSRAGAQQANLRGASDLYANTNEQAGIMRAQEQIAAQQQYGQHLRDMRQQDLVSRGYGIEEANAMLDAEMKVQEINAGAASGDAQRAQSGTMGAIGTIAGIAALSDVRAKEIMYSDFRDKEIQDEVASLKGQMSQMGGPLTGSEAMVNVPPSHGSPIPPPQQMGASGYGFQQPLQVQTTALDDSADAKRRELGERLMAGMGGEGGSDPASSAATGFQIGQAIGGGLMGSDFRSKELGKAKVGSGSTFDVSPNRARRMGTFLIKDAERRAYERDDRDHAADYWKRMSARARELDSGGYTDGRVSMSSDFRQKDLSAELDQVADDAMLPYREMDAADSRRALGPVDPVVYRYKPEHSERMALETGATPGERSMVYQDKRTPRLGIIAQDLQKSPAFDDSVMNTPAGLAVERDRALSTALGSLAGLDKRMRQIERMRSDRSLMNELEDMGDARADEIRGEPEGSERRRRAKKEGRIPRAMGKQAAEMERMRRMYQEATRDLPARARSAMSGRITDDELWGSTR